MPSKAEVSSKIDPIASEIATDKNEPFDVKAGIYSVVASLLTVRVSSRAASIFGVIRPKGFGEASEFRIS